MYTYEILKTSQELNLRTRMLVQFTLVDPDPVEDAPTMIELRLRSPIGEETATVENKLTELNNDYQFLKDNS